MTHSFQGKYFKGSGVISQELVTAQSFVGKLPGIITNLPELIFYCTPEVLDFQGLITTKKIIFRSINISGFVSHLN